MTVGRRSLLGARADAILEPFNPTFPQTRPTVEKAFNTASRADVESMFGLYSCGRSLPMFLDLQQRPWAVLAPLSISKERLTPYECSKGEIAAEAIRARYEDLGI